MKHLIFVVCFSCLFLGGLYAQKDTVQQKYFIYGTFGLSAGQTGFSASDEIVSLIKDTKGRNLQDEVSTYKKESYSYGLEANSTITLGIGIKIRQKENSFVKHSLLRMGLSYGTADLLSSYYYSDTSVFVGVYSNSNPDLPPFSVFKNKFESMSLTYKTHNIQINVNQLFFTSDKKWISFYTGYGIKFGHSVQSDVFIQKTISNRYTTDNKSIVYNIQSDSYEFELLQYKAKGTLSGSIEVPIGIQARLGKKRKVLKNLCLGAEIHGDYNWAVIPGIGFRAKPGFSLVFPMLRYNLWK